MADIRAAGVGLTLALEMRQPFDDLVRDPAEATIVVDEGGAIVFANERAAHVFGYVNGEFIGLMVEQLLPARLRLAHIGRRLEFTDSHGVRSCGALPAVMAHCKDGTERAVAIDLSIVMRGLRSFVVATIRS